MTDAIREDRARTLDQLSVSRETLARLDTLAETLLKWQRRTNLVANQAVSTMWSRHIADSLQLGSLVPDARSWLDFGSGGGFPGLVVAADRANMPGFHMTLVESNGRKCAFLRDAARQMSLNVTVLDRRVETIDPPPRLDIVSARAVAALPVLIDLAQGLLKTGVAGLFPKGQDVERELTEATKSWSFRHRLVKSVTDPTGWIVVVSDVHKR